MASKVAVCTICGNEVQLVESELCGLELELHDTLGQPQYFFHESGELHGDCCEGSNTTCFVEENIRILPNP